MDCPIYEQRDIDNVSEDNASESGQIAMIHEFRSCPPL